MKPQITLHILSTCRHIQITLQDKLILGRCVAPETDGTPHLDLSPFLAYQLRVSRRHLMLVRQANDDIFVFDLASSNGSFINGQRLSAHQGHTLQDRDELLLGSLAIRVYFCKEIPFAHLQTHPFIPTPLKRTDTPSPNPLAAPEPDIRETLTTQTHLLPPYEVPLENTPIAKE